jgi:hypothetical protein
LSHRVSFSRVAACLKLACRYRNTSVVLKIFLWAFPEQSSR